MPESTPAPASPSGQGAAVGKATAPAQTTPSSSSAPAVGKPHFEYEWEDGTKDSYATEEDFKRAWREGRLRHKDYTQKTMELAKQRKQFESERNQLNEISQNARKLHDQWKPIDDWMKQRPDIKDYIVQNMRNPSPGAISEQIKESLGGDLESVKSELQQLKEWRAKQEEERRKQAMYDHLASQYEDFNPQEIEEELQKFNESPDQDDMRNIAELIYWAKKGRTVPRKVGEEVVAGPAPANRKMPPVPAGKATRPMPEEKPKNLREAAEMWKRKHAKD
jgi:hypothetical protein